MRRGSRQIRVDIHGLTEVDAYCMLLGVINDAGSDVKKILVIHGYHGGEVLKNMVREFNHFKIDYIQAPFHNDGESIIHLK